MYILPTLYYFEVKIRKYYKINLYSLIMFVLSNSLSLIIQYNNNTLFKDIERKITYVHL